MAATGERVEAEREAERHEDRVRAARTRLGEATSRAPTAAAPGDAHDAHVTRATRLTGGAVGRAAQFLGRLRADVTRATAAREAHVAGPLRAAQVAEAAARVAHVEAARARQALEAHAARQGERVRKAAARREERVADDDAGAAKARRAPGDRARPGD